MISRFVWSIFIWSIPALLSLSCGYAQVRTIDFNQLDSLQRVEERHIVTFIQTDWCKHCLRMKNSTLKDDSVVDLLNNTFYFTSLNAESKHEINYAGRIFKYSPSGNNTGVHELAVELGTINGQLNYPAISILNAKNEIVFQYSGMMKRDALLAVLRELLKQDLH